MGTPLEPELLRVLRKSGDMALSVQKLAEILGGGTRACHVSKVCSRLAREGTILRTKDEDESGRGPYYRILDTGHCEPAKPDTEDAAAAGGGPTKSEPTKPEADLSMPIPRIETIETDYNPEMPEVPDIPVPRLHASSFVKLIDDAARRHGYVLAGERLYHTASGDKNVRALVTLTFLGPSEAPL